MNRTFVTIQTLYSFRHFFVCLNDWELIWKRKRGFFLNKKNQISWGDKLSVFTSGWQIYDSCQVWEFVHRIVRFDSLLTKLSGLQVCWKNCQVCKFIERIVRFESLLTKMPGLWVYLQKYQVCEFIQFIHRNVRFES